MMATRNKVEVRIAGKDYTIVGVEADDYIQKVALFVDKKMAEVVRGCAHLSSGMAAVLTAINVADELHKVNEKEGNLRREHNTLSEEAQKLKCENERIMNELETLKKVNSGLQIELAKREAELSEVRNSSNKFHRYA